MRGGARFYRTSNAERPDSNAFPTSVVLACGVERRAVVAAPERGRNGPGATDMESTAGDGRGQMAVGQTDEVIATAARLAGRGGVAAIHIALGARPAYGDL